MYLTPFITLLCASAVIGAPTAAKSDNSKDSNPDDKGCYKTESLQNDDKAGKLDLIPFINQACWDDLGNRDFNARQTQTHCNLVNDYQIGLTMSYRQHEKTRFMSADDCVKHFTAITKDCSAGGEVNDGKWMYK